MTWQELVDWAKGWKAVIGVIVAALGVLGWLSGTWQSLAEMPGRVAAIERKLEAAEARDEAAARRDTAIIVTVNSIRCELMDVPAFACDLYSPPARGGTSGEIGAGGGQR